MKVLSNIARGKGQADAQKRCGYGPITLRREGDFAIVEVEYDGEHYEVIREHLDSNFCHTVHPSGIRDVLQRGEVTLA
jgi:hypothetical protein